MNPFEYLGNEHRELVRVLAVLERLADRVAAGEHIERSDLDVVVDYFREIGDMAHHDKEETLLVPALVRHNMDWYDGPLAEMRRAHRQERYLMRNLRHAARQTREWSEEDKRHFVSIARTYAEFLRAHLLQENEEWFVRAAEKLPAEEQLALTKSFEAFDAELDAMPDYRAIRTKALALIEKYRHS